MLASFKPDEKHGRCAFCKNWYDPENKFILPSFPKQGIWKFESSAKCLCLRWNSQKGAGMRCEYYQCKLK